MNFSYFKKIYENLREKAGAHRVQFSLDLWWRIIIVCFVSVNIFSAIFGFFLFKKVSSDQVKDQVVAPEGDLVFSRAELNDLLKFYREKENTLAKLKKSTVVRKDPSF